MRLAALIWDAPVTLGASETRNGHFQVVITRLFLSHSPNRIPVNAYGCSGSHNGESLLSFVTRCEIACGEARCIISPQHECVFGQHEISLSFCLG